APAQRGLPSRAQLLTTRPLRVIRGKFLAQRHPQTQLAY
ncbi:MAG: hypothetical protein ACI9SE_003848, partial [Neolewinella sp.]